MTVVAGEAARPAAAGAAPTAPDDPSGFGEWVRPHLGPMAHLVARLAPAADRDDVVQEALVRAWTKRHQYDPTRGTPAGWLLAIAADQAGKSRRRLRRYQPIMVELFPDDLAEDRTEAARRLDRGRADAGRVDLERALKRLSRRQRTAVECVYFVGLTVADTANLMGCAEGTVKSTLADARARLRRLLEVKS
ncbi:MAG TPA: RNA polymerase sigma factor [Micromonosporaceae bacterium]